MRKCVFPLLLLLVACSSPSPAPHPAEVPVQPLVIGTSPPVPIATSPHEPIAAAEPGGAQTPLAVPARDPRLSKGTRRSRALVTTEVTALDQLAEQAYREVLKYPPAQNVVYVEAQHRLSEIKLR